MPGLEQNFNYYYYIEDKYLNSKFDIEL